MLDTIDETIDGLVGDELDEVLNAGRPDTKAPLDTCDDVGVNEVLLGTMNVVSAADVEF